MARSALLSAALLDVAIPAAAADLPGLRLGLRRRRTSGGDVHPGRSLASGIDVSGFDKAVRPQDDLFLAVNGDWLAKTAIPADHSDYGIFTILADNSEKDVREIIEGCVAKDNPPGSERQKVGDLYASFMDEARVEKLGTQPIAAHLAAVDAIKTKADLIRTLAFRHAAGLPGLEAWAIDL